MLSDGDEVNVHGTDPTNPDTDGGGVDDGTEVLTETDPLDPSDDLVEGPASVNLFDAEGFRWDLRGDGTVNDGTNDAFDTMYRLRVNNFNFPGQGTAHYGMNGRLFVLGPAPVGSFEVIRRIFVPETGLGFARFEEIIRNLGNTSQTVTVRVEGNLGSDGSTQVIGTSSGILIPKRFAS